MVGLGHINNFAAIGLWDDITYVWVQPSAALSIRATTSTLAPFSIENNQLMAVQFITKFVCIFLERRVLAVQLVKVNCYSQPSLA